MRLKIFIRVEFGCKEDTTFLWKGYGWFEKVR